MPVGIVTTKSTIDGQVGMAAQQIANWARTVTNLHDYLLTMTPTDLAALGYDPEHDVPLLMSAVGDMDKLAKIYRGEVEQTPAYNFQTFILRVAGLQV